MRQSRRTWTLPVIGLLVLVPWTYGAWTGFPVQDDSYLLRILREAGVAGIVPAHPDRPVYGLLLEAAHRVGGGGRLAYILFGIPLWLALAIQTARLWRRLFPGVAERADVVGLLCITPIVVQTQFTTVTTTFPVVLPTVLALESLLILLSPSKHDRSSPARVTAAVLCAAAASLISEYGVATTLAACCLLVILRRPRSVLPLLAGALVGFALFHSVGDPHFRPRTDVDIQLDRLVSDPWHVALRLANAAWSALFSAYGAAASTVALRGSKSELAVLAAGMCGWLYYKADRLSTGELPQGGARIALALGVAVLMALAPAVIACGWPTELVYDTRFVVPALPFAVCATMWVLLQWTHGKYRSLAVASLCALAEARLVLGAFETRSLQLELADLGRRLRPLVQVPGSLTVAVVADRPDLLDLEIQGKACVNWSESESRRLWVVKPGLARHEFGDRLACWRPASWKLHGPARWRPPPGEISEIVWVSGTKSRRLEPYCIEARPTHR